MEGTIDNAIGLQLSLGSVCLPKNHIDDDLEILQAKPFLKWVGGKSQLLGELRSLMPQEQYGTYFEPFVGSGALFFHVNPKDAVINDSNTDLINCYEVIRDNVEELIKALKNYSNDPETYYSVRALDNQKLNSVERAARMIYLNRTCFNGLYRVNQKGQFNTPYGSYSNPRICNEENLKAVSYVLRDIKIVSGDYQKSLKSAKKGDFIYFDPPYLPVSKYSDFKRYTKDSFYDKNHEELAETFKELDSKGCYVMLSNSDHPLAYKLFDGYNIKIVKARRLINKIASGRGKVNELIVRNYE
jgi:DNA adenine methylase